jgi:hypothetical protein
LPPVARSEAEFRPEKAIWTAIAGSDWGEDHGEDRINGVYRCHVVIVELVRTDRHDNRLQYDLLRRRRDRVNPRDDKLVAAGNRDVRRRAVFELQ